MAELKLQYEITIPAGTIVNIDETTGLVTYKVHIGETFSGTLLVPVDNNNSEFKEWFVSLDGG